MAGVRIVARDGGAPSAGALLTRNVFRLVDSLPLCYGVGLITVVLTRDNLRIGDMAAGTLLVFEQAEARLPTPAGDAHRAGRPDPAGRAIRRPPPGARPAGPPHGRRAGPAPGRPRLLRRAAGA